MLFMIYWKQCNENVLIMRVNITYKWDEVYYDMAWLPYYISTLRKSRKVKIITLNVSFSDRTDSYLNVAPRFSWG